MSARSAPSAVVVGGGVAGITAALDLSERGVAVSLLEVRPRLGGAAYSFERDGLHIDNGQHVFLRCCTSYRALLERLGSTRHTRLQARLEIPVLSPARPPERLRRADLPPPLHLAGALLSYGHLSVRERISAARAALALARLDPDDPKLDERGFGDWLAERGQGPRAQAALWDLFALPTLNVPASEASLALGAFVFREGLLRDRAAGDIGFHERPLSEIIGEPAERVLRAAGVDVRLRCRVERVRRDGDALRIETSDGPRTDAAVVIAVGHTRAAGMLPAGALGVEGLLESSPIVNVHVVYDRRVTDERFVAGVGTPVQYVFDRTEAGGAVVGRGQYLAVSLSGAEEELGSSGEVLRERYLSALAELFPRARGARVERFLVTREHAATFRAKPGSRILRPATRTRVPGVLVAGAFTDTGWPATLEGAARSGHSAAAAVLERLARGGPSAGSSSAARAVEAAL